MNSPLHLIFTDILGTSVTLENLVLQDVTYGGSPKEHTRTNARVSFGLIRVQLSEDYRVVRERVSKTEDLDDETDLAESNADGLVQLQCGDFTVHAKRGPESPFSGLLSLTTPTLGTSIVSQLSNIYGSPSTSNMLTFALPLQVTTFSTQSKRKVVYKAPLSADAFSRAVIDGHCNITFLSEEEQLTSTHNYTGSYLSTTSFKPIIGKFPIFPATVPTLLSSLSSPDLPTSVAQPSLASPLYRTRMNSYRYLNTNAEKQSPSQATQSEKQATNNATDSDVVFLTVDAALEATAGAGVQGTNFGEMAASHIEEAIEQIKEKVVEAFMTQTLFFLAEELPAALDMSFEHLVVNNLMSSLQQPLNTIFPYSIAAAVQARLPPLVAKKVSDNVVQDVTMRVVLPVAQRVQRKLARVLPENVEKDAVANIVNGAGADLTHILSLSIPAALTPSLLHTMTHDPQQDYYCYYCEKRELYCKFCHKQRADTARNNYYAEYYTGYYSRYYGNYYKNYFLTIVEENAKTNKQERIQNLYDASWNTMNTLVLERPYFAKEDNHLQYKHRAPPEGIVESGPSGGVAEAWG